MSEPTGTQVEALAEKVWNYLRPLAEEQHNAPLGDLSEQSAEAQAEWAAEVDSWRDTFESLGWVRADEHCQPCAERARIVALIEASSLGTAEAVAARESVPAEVGQAIALAARYMAERDKARAALAERERAVRERVARDIEAEARSTWLGDLVTIRRAAEIARGES